MKEKTLNKLKNNVLPKINDTEKSITKRKTNIYIIS